MDIDVDMDMNISNNIMIHNKTLTQILNLSNEYDFFPNKTDLLEIYWKFIGKCQFLHFIFCLLNVYKKFLFQ